LVFIIKKTMAKMLHLPKSSITKILAKLTKEKEKEREGEGGCHLPKKCSTRNTS
jgi:Mn-dependent DtxR family transcriptional regulator